LVMKEKEVPNCGNSFRQDRGRVVLAEIIKPGERHAKLAEV
jgi:hypothetical protein